MNTRRQYKAEEYEERTPADILRLALRVLVLIAAWVLFFWWWYVVIGRMTDEDVRYVLTFLGVSFAIILTATLIWVAHTRRVSRRGVPRTHVPSIVEDYSRDTLGRANVFKGGPQLMQSHPLVRVALDGDSKVYSVAGK